MSTRQSCILGGSLIVCSLILGTAFGPRTRADEKEAPAVPPMPGRYQMHVVPGQGADEVIVFDTATSQCWFSGTGAKADEWRDLGSPANAPKKKER